MASAIRLHIHHAGPRIDRAGPETTGPARELYCRLALETSARTLIGRRGTTEVWANTTMTKTLLFLPVMMRFKNKKEFHNSIKKYSTFINKFCV